MPTSFLVPATLSASTLSLQFDVVLTPRLFGAVWDGVADDTAAIQAAFDYLLTNNLQGKVYLPPGKTKITSGLTLDSRFVTVEGYCEIDATTLTTGSAIKVTCGGATSAQYGRRGSVTGNIRLLGPGRVVPVDGVLFHSDVSGANAAVNISGMAIKEFNRGLALQSMSYNSTFHDMHIFNCATCVEMPAGFVDCGENFSFFGCKFYNSDRCVHAASVEMFFYGCSFDYTAVMFNVENAQVTLFSGHIEHSSYPATPITLTGDGASFTCYGTRIVCTGTNTVPFIQNDTSPRMGGGVLLSGCMMNSLGAIDFLVSGNGRTVVRDTFSYDNRGNPRAVCASGNLVNLDNPVAYAFVNSDTAQITSRLSGANVTLSASTEQAYAGSSCLKYTKAFGGGSNSGFAIAVPLKGPRMGHVKIRYKKPGANTGTMYINAGYADLLDSPTTPLVRQWKQDATTTVVFAPDPVDWTEFRTTGSFPVAPSWASHVLLTVNGYQLQAGSVYFDGFEAYEGY